MNALDPRPHEPAIASVYNGLLVRGGFSVRKSINGRRDGGKRQAIGGI
jgi:hypothetical protein